MDKFYILYVTLHRSKTKKSLSDGGFVSGEDFRVAEDMGKYRKGDKAEALFGGFLAFMMVMAISTVFLYGFTSSTAVASSFGGIGLVALVAHTRPRTKHTS